MGGVAVSEEMRALDSGERLVQAETELRGLIERVDKLERRQGKQEVSFAAQIAHIEAKLDAVLLKINALAAKQTGVTGLVGLIIVLVQALIAYMGGK